MAVKPKTLKLPKSLGACADLLYETKQERLAAQKIVDEIKARETIITNHIVDNLPKGDTGAAGKHHRAQVKTEEIPQVKDWDAFYQFIHKNKAYELLQRRVSTEAAKERLESGKPVPGLGTFTAVKVSLTAVK